MNALTRWNPFQEMENLQRKMSSLFHRNSMSGAEESLSFPDWVPLVDIAEDDKAYLIKVELPGVRKEDVKATVDNGTLTIAGERAFEKEEKGRKYHRVEGQYGHFERKFVIPEHAISGEVKAEFQDGVLRLHLAKSEKAKPKQILIKVD